MYAPAVSQDNSDPGSLESMGYTVDGYWEEVQCGSEKYRIPRLVIGLFPVPLAEACAVPVHLGHVQSPAAEIRCAILDEVRQTADGSSYLVPRLKITVHVRDNDDPNLLKMAL